MEDVLGIYQLPYCKEVPVICMDEKPLQLLGEVRERISASPIHLDPDTQLPKPGYCEKIVSKNRSSLHPLNRLLLDYN